VKRRLKNKVIRAEVKHAEVWNLLPGTIVSDGLGDFICAQEVGMQFMSNHDDEHD
jgi:hypothetical protein